MRVPVLAGFALVGVLVAGALLLARTTAAPPVIAVGDIRIEAPADSMVPVELLLSTSLARVQGLSVVTEDRVREVALQLVRAGRAAGGDGGVRRAALAAGAAEVVEGVLTRRGSTYRLDFRRVDRDGRASAGHVVEAAALLDVIDLATEHIAADLGLRAPASRADGATASLVAYRLYQQGLDAMYADDHEGARRLFLAALAEDSGFAMAAFRAAQVTSEGREDLFERAMSLAIRSPERERLLITASSMMVLGQRAGVAVAETLAARHPGDPEALMVHGAALMQDARFLDAARQYERAAQLDSMSIHAPERRCRACEARRSMRDALMFADSIDAVERAAREWLRRNPTSIHALSELAQALEHIERFDEAEAAFLRAPGAPYQRSADHMTGVWIRQQRFADVDAHWRSILRAGDESERTSAWWGLFISLRTQGRLEEALAVAREFTAIRDQPLLEGLALLDLGRHAEAARAFESLAAPYAGAVSEADARNHAWYLSQAAAAYAALGDTARLRVIEDTVRVYGARSVSLRDRRLHHYVRGLRLRALGRERDAAAAFEASLFSAYLGYVRAPLELARASIASGDPGRAVEVLRSALRGPISGSGLYASRTELLELLGEAYERNHQPDSAAATYARVLQSWDGADASLQPRVRSVRSRLAALSPDS